MNLRSFTLANVEESHGGDTPGVPTFDEFSGTDENVDGGGFFPDTIEKGCGNLVIIGFNGGFFLFHQFDEFYILTDIDDTEIR